MAVERGYYRDRREAGQILAALLDAYAKTDPLVLAIPRGGVVVGAQVALALGVPLYVALVRKVGAPGNPELAAGAVAVDGTLVREEEVIRFLGIDEAYLREAAARQRAVLQERARRYDHLPPAATGRTTILIDDGVATGSTVRAALRWLRTQAPRELILAVPVGPPDVLAHLEAEADRVVCPLRPYPFGAVGRFFLAWEDVDDRTVVDWLERCARAARAGGSEGKGKGP